MARILLVIGTVLLLSACGGNDEQLNQDEPEDTNKVEEAEETAADVEVTETEEEEQAEESPVAEEEAEQQEDESAEADTTWDDIKNQDNIVGISDKDFTELTKSKPTDVRNDTTGNWKKSTVSENVDIEEYILSYHDLHMEEGEVHHIINFNRNITATINDLGGLLSVDIKERIDGEEHDASTLGSGMLLKSYIVYPDGDIEEIQ